jgi:uncharacterized protein (TIGR02996 family)
MSDGDALIAAILAEPDADLPRLMYADWLDEFGDVADGARAEFIRTQIELIRTPEESVRRRELRAREQALLTAHRGQWLAPLGGPGEPLPKAVTHADFRRGFVERVWMPATWFASRAEVLFARVPARELRVTKAKVDELAWVVASEHFPRLNALDLSDRRLGDDVARVLTRRPSVAAIRTLRLPGCGLTDVGAFCLADADFEWPLAELDVKYNPVSARGLSALRERFGAEVVISSLPG